MIAEGRVTIDGHIATLGERADASRQRVLVDGRPLDLGGASVTLVFHKPPRVMVTAHDERGRATVYEVLRAAGAPTPPDLRYVGRLDFDSEGLLLLTTDGALVHRLTHPRYHVPRVYEAALDRMPAARDLDRLRRGLQLADGPTAPAEVEIVRRDPPVVRMTLHEGRNRQVRRMFEAVGVRVTRLIRTRIGPLNLGRLRPGEARDLTRSELRALRTAVGLEGAGVDAGSGAIIESNTGRAQQRAGARASTSKPRP